MSDQPPSPSEKRDGQFALTLLPLLIAFGACVVSYLQYRSAEKAIRTAHADAIATMKLSNRPYLAVQGSTPGKPGSQGYVVTLHFTASGMSPAVGVAIKRRCGSAAPGSGQGTIDPPPELLARMTSVAGRPDLFSGNSIDYHCLAPADPEGVIRFVFAVGEASYTDVFGDSHKTAFCLETAPDANSSTPMVMQPCTHGNTMQ